MHERPSTGSCRFGISLQIIRVTSVRRLTHIRYGCSHPQLLRTDCRQKSSREPLLLDGIRVGSLPLSIRAMLHLSNHFQITTSAQVCCAKAGSDLSSRQSWLAKFQDKASTLTRCRSGSRSISVYSSDSRQVRG